MAVFTGEEGWPVYKSPEMVDGPMDSSGGAPVLYQINWGPKWRVVHGNLLKPATQQTLAARRVACIVSTVEGEPPGKDALTGHLTGEAEVEGLS